jgi:hypothetical protein
MTNISSARPVPGTDAYWQDRKQAFALLRKLERAIEVRNQAPMYIGIEENIGPWDRVVELQDRAQANPTIVEILTAQNRLALLTV